MVRDSIPAVETRKGENVHDAERRHALTEAPISELPAGLRPAREKLDQARAQVDKAENALTSKARQELEIKAVDSEVVLMKEALIFLQDRLVAIRAGLEFDAKRTGAEFFEHLSRDRDPRIAWGCVLDRFNSLQYAKLESWVQAIMENAQDKLSSLEGRAAELRRQFYGK